MLAAQVSDFCISLQMDEMVPPTQPGPNCHNDRALPDPS